MLSVLVPKLYEGIATQPTIPFHPTWRPLRSPLLWDVHQLGQVVVALASGCQCRLQTTSSGGGIVGWTEWRPHSISIRPGRGKVRTLQGGTNGPNAPQAGCSSRRVRSPRTVDGAGGELGGVSSPKPHPALWVLVIGGEMDLSWKDLALDGGQSSDFGYSSPSQGSLRMSLKTVLSAAMLLCASTALIGVDSVAAYPVPAGSNRVGTEVHSWDSSIVCRPCGRQAVLVHDLPSAKCLGSRPNLGSRYDAVQ